MGYTVVLWVATSEPPPDKEDLIADITKLQLPERVKSAQIDHTMTKVFHDDPPYTNIAARSNFLAALQRFASDPVFAALEDVLDSKGWKPGVDSNLIEVFLSLANDSADEETCAQWRGALELLEELYQKRLSLQPAGTETAGGDSIDNDTNKTNNRR